MRGSFLDVAQWHPRIAAVMNALFQGAGHPVVEGGVDPVSPCRLAQFMSRTLPFVRRSASWAVCGWPVAWTASAFRRASLTGSMSWNIFQ